MFSFGSEVAVRGILTSQVVNNVPAESLEVAVGRKSPLQVVIVGSGPMALSLFRNICERHSEQYDVLGFVDTPNGHPVPDFIRRRLLAPIETLDEILLKHVVDHVMIAMPIKSCYDQIQRAIGVCEKAGVESEYLSQPFAVSVARPIHGSRHSHPVVRFKVVDDDFRLRVKRLIDIVGAVLGLLGLAPLMLLIAAAVAL